MSTNKLKKFASFHHHREIRQEEKYRITHKDSIWRPNDVRRKSFSATEPLAVGDDNVDGDRTIKNDFLRILRKWKHTDNTIKLAPTDKRKSASMGHVDSFSSTSAATEASVASGGKSHTSLRNPALFLSDGNLAASLVTELKERLAARADGGHNKVQVQFMVQQDEQSTQSEGVTLRPRSSQQLRADGAGRARTCIVYPAGSRSVATANINGGSIIKQGPIERVKVGGARRLPRHWDRQRFACLTADGRLCMSEDAAAAVETAQDPVAAAKRTDAAVVDTVFTGGANVVRGSVHSSKKNVIELTEADGRKTLIQNDEAVTSDSWFDALSRAAAGPRMLRGGSLPRSADGRSGSGSDVSAQSAAHDASVRSALGRFFGGGRRPTRESLETRGIYRDEPVFGSRLCALDGEVPFFVRECTRVLGAEPHVLQPGLYRISGNLSRIQRLRLRVDQSATSEQEQRRAISLEEDTDVLAGALKLFFRELRDPLLPYAAYTKLLTVIEQTHNRSEDARLKSVRQVLRDEKLTPPSHLATLALLCRHLSHVCSYERHNQMTATSMAIVWGPSLTWPANSNQDALLQCTHVNRVVEYLISNEKRLFNQ